VGLLRQQGIRDEAVLAAIDRVRREAFVPPELADEAYENVALPIGQGQTISQPYVVALMSEALQADRASRVLEVGTGSGYQAAILAELASAVVSVERVPSLLASAERILGELGYRNVELHPANGTLGWARGAPYDRIIVTAAGPAVPDTLLAQLAVGGRLVMPVGTRTEQELVLVRRTADGFEQSGLGGVRFVPLLGEGAWPE
jgi:protein-L-isoaspartate(D-aspartate) O-methyltransferase